MKKGKKIVIGVAAVAVVAGGIYAASGAGRGGSQIPQVAVTKAETGDVEMQPEPLSVMSRRPFILL